MPPDASADGWRIDRLIDSTLIVSAALAVAVLAWLTYAALRWREGRAAGPRSLARGDSWRAVAMVVGVTTVVFAVVDGKLLVTSLRDLRDGFLASAGAEREPGAVRIEINAQRWAWNVRYAGIDGAFATPDDVVTLNDLRAPLGRPVVVQLASSDVVHSFFVPSFRVKLDAVPGRIATTWFRPMVAGRYEIACSQHCGVHHYLMRGVVTVTGGATFDAWVAAASRDALALAAEDARALAEEPTRARPDRIPPGLDPAEARRWGWPWLRGQAR